MHEDLDRTVASDWDRREALKSLALDADVNGERPAEVVAEEMFREALPMAALAIINIAQSSPNERERRAAATYVVERNLGQLKDVAPSASKQPLDNFMREIIAVENGSIDRARELLKVVAEAESEDGVVIDDNTSRPQAPEGLV